MKYIQLALLVLIFNTSNYSQTIFVNNGNASNGNGTSWAQAFNNLEDAILASTSANQIWIANGVYLPKKDTTGKENPMDNRAKTFFINKNIKLFGGFLGNETTVAMANPLLNPTILSGDIGIVDDSTDNAYHVIYITTNTNSIDNNTIINGITITKGFANLPNVAGQNVHSGGGIYFNSIGNTKNTSPLITNCTFMNNSARTGGACYFNIKGNTVAPIFTNCIFKNNYAGTSPTTISGAGGAIRFDINGNVAAIFNNCLFEQNRSGSGGSIYNICFSGSSYISINNSYFIKNRANSGGVIYSCSNGATVVNKPIFTNSVFSENQGVNVGGVIYNIANSGETSTDAINCIFSKNSSASGAALYNTKAASAVCLPTLKNSIIWDETTAGNEIVNNATSLSTSTLTNCIISDGIVDGTIAPSSGNLFTACIEANPLFLNPANLKGPDALWRTIDDGLNVQTTSLAINAGSNAILPNSITEIKFAKLSENQAITKDITGITNRIMDGVVDIGSFEYAAAVPLPLTILEFTAKAIANDIMLNWKTANALNIDSFLIETSKNGLEFKQIGSLAGTVGDDIFEFLAPKVGNNQIYFRLKIIETTGKYYYSKIISIPISQPNTFILAPNPVKNFAKILSSSKTINVETIKLFDSRGQQVFHANLTNFENNLNFSNILSGIYFLKLETGETIKFLKEQ